MNANNKNRETELLEVYMRLLEKIRIVVEEAENELKTSDKKWR